MLRSAATDGDFGSDTESTTESLEVIVSPDQLDTAGASSEFVNVDLPVRPPSAPHDNPIPIMSEDTTGNNPERNGCHPVELSSSVPPDTPVLVANDSAKLSINASSTIDWACEHKFLEWIAPEDSPDKNLHFQCISAMPMCDTFSHEVRCV
jgi:hypothetical protein